MSTISMSKMMLTTALIFSSVSAQPIILAPKLKAKMESTYPDYSYEIMTVTTDDDYYVPLFRIWNPAVTGQKTKGPILFQHGSGMDGSDWIVNWVAPASPMVFADEGHDVYISNWRGTEYARLHKTLDETKSSDAAAYWDFDNQDLAKDMIANIKAMTAKTASSAKGFVVSYSMGTDQSLIAMVDHSAELNDTIEKFVLLAPCPDLQPLTGLAEPGALKDQLGALGIYWYGGVTWAADYKNICDNGSAELCKAVEYGIYFTQTISLKVFDTQLQDYKVKRYQEYVDDWSFPDKTTSRVYPLETIAMPVTIFVAEKDETCPEAKAKTLVDILPNLKNYVTVPEQGHEYFLNASTATFTKQLQRELVAQEPTYVSLVEGMFEPASTEDGAKVTDVTKTDGGKKTDDDDDISTNAVILIAIAMVCVVCIIVVVAIYCMKAKVGKMPKLETVSLTSTIKPTSDAQVGVVQAEERIDIANNAVTPVLDK